MRLFRLLIAARRSLPRVLPLFRNELVPFHFKMGAVAAALLIVSPLDLLGDIPIIGWLDDALLLMLVANVFVFLAERALRFRDSSYQTANVRVVGPRALHR